MASDWIKCKALKDELGRMTPREAVVAIEKFLDGNDDMGSIGCNLSDHPGMETFRSTFAVLGHRPDVRAIYARVAEVDPGDNSWPFTDTIFVVGEISAATLRDFLNPLQPDEVAAGDEFEIQSVIKAMYNVPVLAAWWD